MVYDSVFKRVEKKYRTTPRQRAAVEAAARDAGAMAVDVYGRTRITSLYLDTPERAMIARSVEKPLYKEKLRLRAYGEAAGAALMAAFGAGPLVRNADRPPLSDAEVEARAAAVPGGEATDAAAGNGAATDAAAGNSNGGDAASADNAGDAGSAGIVGWSPGRCCIGSSRAADGRRWAGPRAARGLEPAARGSRLAPFLPTGGAPAAFWLLLNGFGTENAVSTLAEGNRIGVSPGRAFRRCRDCRLSVPKS